MGVNATVSHSPGGRATPPRLDLSLAPEPSRLLRARERIRDYVTQHCGDQTIVNDVVLAIQEACSNAIRHGGVTDDIEISIGFEGRDLRATVKDKGRGFDVAAFDPDALPDPLLDHGRGLFLMSRLCDQVDLCSDRGLEVRLVKRAVLQAAPAPDAHDHTLQPASHVMADQTDRLRIMLEEIDEAFFALDWEYRYVHANVAGLHTAGKETLEELLGHTPWELFPQLRGSPLEERYRQAMELGRPSVTEHRSVYSGDWLEVRIYPTPAGVSAYYREINERKRLEREHEAGDLEREATIGFLRLINESDSLATLLRAATAFFQQQSGCEAVGIRLRDGDDYPFVETRGFPTGFVARESRLCSLDGDGRVCRDAAGLPILECRCGDVIRGRFDAAQESFTEKGSFWTSAASELLATGSEADRRLWDRDGCDVAGYESVALIALSTGDECLGLLQVSDRLAGRFAVEDIVLWERLADQLAVAIAKARLEEELSESREHERFLAEVVETADVPFVVREPSGRLLLFNRAFTELVGYSRTELEEGAATVAVGITPPKWFEAEKPLLAKAVARRRPVRYEKEYVRKDGRRVPVEVFAQPVFDEAGTLLEYRSFVTDISERKRAEEELRLHNDELAERAHLADALNAINRLLHATLDFDTIMRSALDEGAEALGADVGMIEMREGAHWVVRYTRGLAGLEPGLRLTPAEARIASRVERRGEPLAIADTLTEGVPEAPFVGARPLRSLVAVPLLARAAVIGCLVFRGNEAHAYSDAEIDFTRKLGATVSLALENARLYEEQQRIAQTLQENFIHPLPEVAGLELGVVARAATEPELVGGDFSDVFVADDAHVVLLIGDVAGKGVHAAGLTESVRSTVRALAAVDPSPPFILGKTNELLLRLDSDEPHVTAFVAVLDQRSGRVDYASAGHPSPLRLGATACGTLGLTCGPPLGTFVRPYANAHVRLAPQEYLVLYTDGVTEARRGRELLGEGRLLEIVAGLRGRPAQGVAEGVCDGVLAFAGSLRDDLQIVVLRLDRVTG